MPDFLIIFVCWMCDLISESETAAGSQQFDPDLCLRRAARTR